MENGGFPHIQEPPATYPSLWTQKWDSWAAASLSDSWAQSDYMIWWIFIKVFFFKCLLIYFERARERESRGGAEREKEKDSQAGFALSAHGARCGARSHEP